MYLLYHNEDLKSLTRYRFDKVSERAKLKQSVSRLLNILFPELEKLVSTVHSKAIYELLAEFPGASHIATANLKHLKAEHLLIAPTLIQYHDEQGKDEVRGQELTEPIMTLDTSNRYALSCAHIMKNYPLCIENP